MIAKLSLQSLNVTSLKLIWESHGKLNHVSRENSDTFKKEMTDALVWQSAKNSSNWACRGGVKDLHS